MSQTTRSPRHLRRLGRRRPVLVALVALVAVGGLAACKPELPPDTYVALGDSSVSGATLEGVDIGALNCTRNLENWPKHVSRRLALPRFVDVSCAGATTFDLSSPQQVSPANPPQFNALDRMTKVVTVTMGANDTPWGQVFTNCAQKSLMLQTCRGDYVRGSSDVMRDSVLALRPRYDAMIAEIKKRAPRAKIFLVGYPRLIPLNDTGCYPNLPLLTSDLRWLREIELLLDATARNSAVANGVKFIDVKPAYEGHDVCSGDRWLEGVLPGSLTMPVHANLAGHRGTAPLVAAAIEAELRS